MAIIAIFSPKGGVGKTSLAVNLAWVAASLHDRRTLLWDLDAQASASFILAPDATRRGAARAVLERSTAAEQLIVATGVRGLDLLPAYASLRALDTVFAQIDANKRLRRIGEALGKHYDRVLIDCPPGLGVTADQVVRSASLILMPLIPSTLSMRAALELRQHLDERGKGAPPLLPVFNMVDRRRAAHREALAEAPGQPAIPMASAIEQMADRHAALGAFAPRSPAAEAIAALWAGVEARLAAPPAKTVQAPKASRIRLPRLMRR